MFFQNLCLLGIISGLFERNGVGRVCLPWLTSPRFSTSRNASFSPRSRPNSGRLSALDQQFCEVMALTDPAASPTATHGAATVVRPVRAPGWRTPSSPRAFISSPPPARIIDALKSRPLWCQLCGWESTGEAQPCNTRQNPARRGKRGYSHRQTGDWKWKTCFSSVDLR